MYVKSIFYLLLFCLTSLRMEAQQATWSLPTPKSELPASLIPYPKKVIRRQGTVRFSSLEASDGDYCENAPKLRAELEDINQWWGMNEREKK